MQSQSKRAGAELHYSPLQTQERVSYVGEAGLVEFDSAWISPLLG